MTEARYAVGQVIHHKLLDYRGVVVDVDPIYSGSDDWYERVAKSRPPKDKPWYHILVDDGEHNTYVSEQNLEADWSNEAVNHPLIGELFTGFEGGKYIVNWLKN
ncbi:MAG TPA: heat shock protein HspQ [Gammaproteobacteria bacterium]